MAGRSGKAFSPREEIKQIAMDGAKLVKQLSEEYEGNFLFEYSPESFTGTEVDYAVEVCNAVLLCAERYLLPLQSGRMALQPRIIPGEAGYPQAAACLQEAEEANKVKNTGYELAIKGALLRFLSILIGQHGTPLPADTTDTRRLKTVLQLIEAEYATPLRIEDAAEACGCSQSHFMRWFKKMTGQGFTAYLNDHRLNLAAELLRITDATVLDIAGRVGFDNLSYFNRLFKRRYGMTPREYRSK